jgi:hypothetical protein
MVLPLIDILLDGGCYWPDDERDGLYSSLVFPSGTHFKIALEGEMSRRFVAGQIEDGTFKILEGKQAGERFPTASSAVNAVRQISTNAFLYIHFSVNGVWVKADTARKTGILACDPVHEEAFKIADRDARNSVQRSGHKISEIKNWDQKIAALVRKDPSRIEEAERRLKARQSITHDDLDF